MELQANPLSGGTTMWPRRAAKACASCRRDKIRCDGARPCSNCTKKGYGDRCIDGCEQCRRARVRCEDGKPCQRCREMNLECIDEIISIPVKQDSVLVPPRVARGGTERAKLACTNCRRDNKKCDDQRPCSRCIARSEECIHIARGPKLVKLRCEGCRQDNKRCEDSRPCRYCSEVGKECIALPRKGRGHGTRVKAACMNCRRDKIRCDGVRPCSTCVRKGCECIDRSCKLCSRDGRVGDCNHRKGQDFDVFDDGEMGSFHAEMQPSSSNHAMQESHKHQEHPPQHEHHPQMDSQQQQQQQNLQYYPQMMHPHSHPMYPHMPSHSSHYYYPQHDMGEEQQQPMPMSMPYQMYTPNRHPYYPVIDPELSNGNLLMVVIDANGSNIRAT